MTTTITTPTTSVIELTTGKISVKMLMNLQQEFRNKGFITDPRGEHYNRSLYNPELKVSVHIRSIGRSSAYLQVFDMINEGMNWGTAYNKLKHGVEIKFNHKNKTFEQFFNTTFTNRVNKLNNFLSK